MARPTDRSEDRSEQELEHKAPSDTTLPPAELNPLINPLLAKNMGRWAETYFTSPPEKREEAVLALLRELEREGPAEHESHVSKPQTLSSTFSSPKSASAEDGNSNGTSNGTSSDHGEAQVVCQSCGEKNEETQKFCGMCGAPLQQFFAQADADSGMSDEPGWHSSKSEFLQHYESRTYGNTRDSDARESGYNAYPRHTSDGERLYRNSNASGQDIGEELPTLLSEYQPSPYRYRVYVGLVLAVLIGGLGYMAWRGTEAAADKSHPLPAAPSSGQAESQPPAAPAQQPAVKPAETEQTTDQTSKAGSTAARPGSQQEAASMPPARSSTSRVTNRMIASQPKDASPKAPGGGTQASGGQELAMAENFLNGGQGKVRDSNEAAKWLWQAVRKENPTATLLLSDLYLRGDGVPKNCDQARLLLDAAARKGAAGAEQRLRNLQAFGCQ